MSTTFEPQDQEWGEEREAKRLTNDQIELIEEALSGVGLFGEVRLVIEKGRLRYIVTQKSIDALKWKTENGGRK